jgi:hypothetical protein
MCAATRKPMQMEINRFSTEGSKHDGSQDKYENKYYFERKMRERELEK